MVIVEHFLFYYRWVMGCMRSKPYFKIIFLHLGLHIFIFSTDFYFLVITIGYIYSGMMNNSNGENIFSNNPALFEFIRYRSTKIQIFLRYNMY